MLSSVVQMKHVCRFQLYYSACSHTVGFITKHSQKKIPMFTSSNVSICLTSSMKPEDIHFTVIKVRKAAILKAETSRYWVFVYLFIPK